MKDDSQRVRKRSEMFERNVSLIQYEKEKVSFCLSSMRAFVSCTRISGNNIHQTASQAKEICLTDGDLSPKEEIHRIEKYKKG